MERRTLEWFEILARGLAWAGGIVLLLAFLGAVLIASADNSLPLLEDAQRQGRAIFAIASLGGGLAAAGILSGLGAILRILATDRLVAMGPARKEAPGPADGGRARAAERRS